MTNFQKNMLSLLKKRKNLSEHDFNTGLHDALLTENESPRDERIHNYFHTNYGRLFVPHQEPKLKLSYAEAFYDLLADFIEKDLKEFEESKLYTPYRKIQEIIEKDIAARPEFYRIED